MRHRSRIVSFARRAARAALFASLVASSPARASVDVDEEEIVFRLAGVEASRVYLAGDFNGWNPTVDLMTAGDGGFEIRLYLLPGHYRYRFVADGVSIADPDNPCRDDGGNSCFTLLDRGGALAIVLAETGTTAAGGAERLSAASLVAAHAKRRDAGASAEAAVRGEIGGAVSLEGAVGLVAASADEEDLRGRSFLLRASAAYRFGDRTLRVFARSDSVAAGGGDLLPILGTVGAYRYPAGLFLRGASLDARLPLRLDGRVLYASRIRGYRSGLDAPIAPGDTSYRRALADDDALVARIAGRLGGADVEALYRYDRRPLEPREPLSAAAGDRYDEIRIRGFRATAGGAEGLSIEGGALFGRVDREEREREGGHRMALGVSRDGERVEARVSFARTTIEDRVAAAPAATRDELAAAMAVDGGDVRLRASAGLEIYGSAGRGERFRLAASSFWLDGDDVGCGYLPFLSAREVYEAGVSLEWKRELLDGLPWGRGLAVEMKRRAATGSGAPVLDEAHLASGVPIVARATLLVDMRGAFYRYGPERRDFIDAFLGVHGRLFSGCWLLLGCGVAPWDFDPWLFRYTGHGRERYLEDRGVFEAYAAGGEREAVLRLLDAEEALAEEWNLTLQAGFTF